MSRERKLKLSLVESYNKANIFLGLIEYELNSLLGISHLVDYISVHIRFDLERYLLNVFKKYMTHIIITVIIITNTCQLICYSKNYLIKKTFLKINPFCFLHNSAIFRNSLKYFIT